MKAGVEEEIRKIALKNAVEYGKAQASSVISKSLSRFPELRADIGGLSKAVSAIVNEINSMDADELKKAASAHTEEFRREDRERLEKSSQHSLGLEGAVSGSFMTRFPPEPNGYLQIGHAKVAWIEREAADFYRGMMALYFDDTNPEKEKQEFVDAIRKDMKWLGIKYDTEYFASDNIQQLYKHAEKMINDGNAYVCQCTLEEMKDGRMRGVGCKHRRQKADRNLALWKEMFTADESNGMVLRLNANMKDDNTTMRDPTLFRIKSAVHYRQGSAYRVWPTYTFNTPIIDSMKGITDVIRSKEFELTDAVYGHILDVLGLRKPRVHSIARLEIKGNLTSKRKTNELIRQGLLWGYDDPRLVTIAGLRRRGIVPAAIKSFVTRFGLSKSRQTVGIDMLLAENRKLVDGNAKRLFFVEKPVRLVVHGIPEKMREVKMRLHPGSDLGYRRYRLSSIFFINTYDANKVSEGVQVRLKDAFSVKVKALEGNDIVAEYTDNDDRDMARIQWVNEGNYIPCRVYSIGDLFIGEEFNKESMVLSDGYVESHAESLEVNEVVQFERVGYFKLDSKQDLGFISL